MKSSITSPALLIAQWKYRVLGAASGVHVPTTHFFYKQKVGL
jgi:hypothetical protein